MPYLSLNTEEKQFNGESDHVHLLIEYKPDIALSVLIANLKTVSSRWKGMAKPCFHWQKFISPLNLKGLTGVLFLHYR